MTPPWEEIAGSIPSRQISPWSHMIGKNKSIQMFTVTRYCSTEDVFEDSPVKRTVHLSIFLSRFIDFYALIPETVRCIIFNMTSAILLHCFHVHKCAFHTICLLLPDPSMINVRAETFLFFCLLEIRITIEECHFYVQSISLNIDKKMIIPSICSRCTCRTSRSSWIFV